MKKNLSLLAVLVLSLLFSGCGTSQPVAEPTPSAIKVKTQSLADSKEIRQDLEYPAIVSASTEAKLVAKSSGNLSGADFKVCDEVKIG